MKSLDEYDGGNSLTCSIDASKLQYTIPDNQDGLETPIIKSKPHITQIDGLEDLASSDFNSLNTPLMTEELLINEKIEFLPSESPSISDNYSLTYTKTLGSDPSSSFAGLQVSNVFLNSSPQSIDQSFINTHQDIEKSYKKIIRSHTEIGEEYLKIPNLTLQSLRDDRVRILIEESLRKNTCEEGSNGNREESLEEIEKIEECLENLGTSGRVYEGRSERPGGFCSCGWCVVI